MWLAVVLRLDAYELDPAVLLGHRRVFQLAALHLDVYELDPAVLHVDVY